MVRRVGPQIRIGKSVAEDSAMGRPETDRVLRQLFRALDWEGLGGVYCDEGGEAFWAEHRGKALRLGLRWADALLPRLRPSGRSLYVGGGVADLPAIVAEIVERGRSVHIANLRDAECRILAAGFDKAGLAGSVAVEAADAGAVAAGIGGLDHVSMVSVLTDPETWPQVSAVGYGRMPPALLDVEAFARERAAIEALVDALLGAAAAEAVFTTTVEEVPWLLRAADRLDVEVEADDVLVESAIVGDPIGFLAVRRRSPSVETKP
jgi:hypothetical protein